MSLESLGTQTGSGGTNIPNLGKVLKELQGLNVSVATGAAAASKTRLLLPLGRARASCLLLRMLRFRTRRQQVLSLLRL
jgi:hypothetical protein